tara:strand:- start:40 stop:228 length:189 start_codon:yes stop_codon:yes gene_type:complete
MMHQLVQMTWNNPIFMMVAIGAIWFVPGIIIRRVTAEKLRIAKQKAQEKKIAKLYPKGNQNN